MMKVILNSRLYKQKSNQGYTCTAQYKPINARVAKSKGTPYSYYYVNYKTWFDLSIVV